jgi:diguanylate cyclase (GGDEF)-like protein
MELKTPQESEAALERLLYILSALGEMAEQLTTHADPQSSIRSIVRMARGAFDLKDAALFLYRMDDQTLEKVSEGDETGITLPLSVQTRRYFLAEGGFPFAPDEDPHPALAEFLESEAEALASVPRALWLPLSVNRNFLGLLALGEKRDKQSMTRMETDLLTLIGRQFTVALHNSQLNAHLKAANLQLGLKVRQLEELYDISRDISSSLDRGRITRELIIRTIELVDARKGLLLTLNEAGDRLEAGAQFGFEGLLETPAWPLQAAWLASLMETRAPTLLDEGLPEAFSATSCLAVPITYQDRLYGVLAVFDKEDRSSVGSFSEDDVPLLIGLSSQAATAIENARLYELATMDGLTQLYIRRHFEQRLTEELRRAERYGTEMSLILLDIDHFKTFNDTYGHATGDAVLRLVAKTLKASVREDLDIPARYGGEELVVLMPETDSVGAFAMAERVRLAIEAASMPGPEGVALHVTVSIGVATWPHQANDEESLFSAADKALYASKQGGRNRSTLAGKRPVPEA